MYFQYGLSLWKLLQIRVVLHITENLKKSWANYSWCYFHVILLRMHERDKAIEKNSDIVQLDEIGVTEKWVPLSEKSVCILATSSEGSGAF